VPAAAVIPAPIAYIKVAAVKKLVVGIIRSSNSPCEMDFYMRISSLDCETDHSLITLRKVGCSKQVFALNILAWNNDYHILR
jgi:hypothetical protein